MIIYKVTNKINGKSYIGQTTQTLPKRKKEHIKSAFRSKDGKNYFHWALVEYGKENFEWTVLEACNNKNELNDREKFYIEKFRTNLNDTGYNGTQGGQGISQRGKLRRLLKNWPNGTIKTVKELNKLGYTSQLLKMYSNSRWIELLGRGMYKLYGDEVTWEGILYGKQRKTKTTLHAGGKTALTLKGYSHYVHQGKDNVYLFSDRTENFNAWLKKNNQLILKRNEVFDYNNQSYFSSHNTGSYEILISSPELAAMEMLYLVPLEQSFDEAIKIMDGLTTLRSKICQSLLETSKSIKVKRLFLFMAEKNGHSWFKELNPEKINLGSGKREIVRGGVLNKKYQITVLRDYAE
jgi:group I intron endonuclease